MRAAFEFMLSTFDPDVLQEQFDRQIKRASLLGVPVEDVISKRFAATVSYDGGAFVGSQRQPNGRTVQEELETAAASLFGEACRVGDTTLILRHFVDWAGGQSIERLNQQGSTEV